MSAPKPALNVEGDPVLAALENAPLDEHALTPEEAEALDAQIAAAEIAQRRSETALLRRQGRVLRSLPDEIF